MVAAALTVACSSDGAETPASAAGLSGSGGGGGGGSASNAAGSGGIAQSGASAGGSIGAGGAGAGGISGSAGAGQAGSAGGGAGPVSYECSQFMGPNVTHEWFTAGFEEHVEGDKWQVKAPHRSFVEDWADPGHAVWRETNCEGTFFDCETKSACAGGATPDRVLFVTQTGDYMGTTQQKWEAEIKRAITTLSAKYPNLKRVELLTFLRGPNNTSCGGETTVAPALDAAQTALAETSNGFITVGPRFELPNCSYFGSAPHLTAAGNEFAADMIGEHYAME